MRDPGALSIGEVITLLREDYPDLTVSKVRFLEQEGLIHPGRSPSGYRQFRSSDIKRLRFILNQQVEHYLPLKVIKNRLADWEAGDDIDVPDEDVEIDFSDLAEEELLEKTGLTARQLDQLVEHDVLDGAPFRPESVVIGREARRLLAMGFESRHLRTARISARRQADLIAGLTAGRRTDDPDLGAVWVDAERALRTLQQGMLREEVRKLR